jgi:hypothetical protein
MFFYLVTNPTHNNFTALILPLLLNDSLFALKSINTTHENTLTPKTTNPHQVAPKATHHTSQKL